MRIEELVLEGFKSYPVRTQITGWDSSFNAITGLNGSGKSNILDAICFVLGITNMSVMRAANQQDLIYKRGQAGITKASVTIVFDNSDRSKSPVGFEDHRQITVTRQIALPNVSKYLLNGHKSLQQNVQTLFQSVQLNINNPNFVIMQGRITKVLNMRPQEILGMVEEAAGTRMFEERKDKAKKTMSKKDKRVQEILSLLSEEITPKLEKLRSEKRSFLAYQKSCTELEKIARKLRAWDWCDGQQRVKKKDIEIEAKREEMRSVEEGRGRAVRECEAAEKEAEEVTKKRDAEMRKGGKMKKLEDNVAELGKELVKIKTQADLKEGSIKDEEASVGMLEKELEELQTSLKDKTTQVETLTASYSTVKDQHTANQKTLSTAEELLQTLLTGLSSNNSNAASGGGYMGQLASAKQRVAQGEAEEEQARVKLSMSEKEMKGLKGRWNEVEREAKEGERKVKEVKKVVESLRERLGKCGWDEEMDKKQEEGMKAARSEIRELNDSYERLKQSLPRLNFEYSDPSPNFNRAKVKGPAASLMSLEEKHFDKATALEIAAGGKLYNIVVEDQQVGKDLLKNGQLRKRVTIIPLNKITAYTLPAKKLDAANRLAPGKVHQALSLVGYSQEVANAMSYVFSDNLICADADSAKRVTFSSEVAVRSVTLEGDVYDPSGSLTGGAAPSGSGILIKAQELMDIGGRFEVAKKTLEGLEKEGERKKQGREEWRRLKRELEMKEHEGRLMEEQVGDSNAARVGTQVEELKKTIADLQLAVDTAKEKQKTAKEECKKLEKDMAEFKSNKDGKIDELKANISKQKAALQKQAVTVKTQQKEVQTASLELQQMEKDLESATTNLEEAKAGMAKLRKELSKLNEQVATSEAAHAKAEEKLQEERATLSRFDKELKDLANVIKEKKQAASQADLNMKSLEHAIQVLGKEKTTAIHFVANLEKMYDWIADESDQFGKPGTMYDFEGVDIVELKERASQLEDSQKGLKKKVNPKVMNMIDNVEKREDDLKRMLATVMKDKEKIEETIEELDRYKRDALQKTWEKVNCDFGGIFAELLPGNFAKLQPPDGQDLMDGLEVKVQLGSVWKQSLTELSGGQRSLIALSLIMALLQFKPAPMYILDEIDAALDLSHTQHIGQLFRTRFKGSQFIVVSLKEGLFTNANVLFRARFRDNTSIVERTAQRSGSALYASNERDRNADDGEERNARHRRAGGG